MAQSISEQCAFCQIIRGEREGHTVFEDAVSLANTTIHTGPRHLSILNLLFRVPLRDMRACCSLALMAIFPFISAIDDPQKGLTPPSSNPDTHRFELP